MRRIPSWSRKAPDASTDPVAHSEPDDAPKDAPQPQPDHPESMEAADADKGLRSFFGRISRRTVLVPLACPAAFLIGFGSVSAVLRLTARSGQPTTKPAPTTAPPAAAPAITTPPTSAPRAAASKPTPPAPEPAPEPAAATAAPHA